MKPYIKITDNRNLNKAYYLNINFTWFMKQDHHDFFIISIPGTYIPVKNYKTIRLLSSANRIYDEIKKLNK